MSDELDPIEAAIENARQEPDADAILPVAEPSLTKLARDERVEVDLQKGDLDATEEEAIYRQEGSEHGIVVPQEPEHVPVPLQNSLAGESPTQGAKNEVYEPFKGNYDFGSIECSDEDKSMFLRAALNEEPVVFKIEIEGLASNVEVEIAPPAYTNDAVWAIERWAEKKELDLDSNMQWTYAFQVLHILRQIQAINGIPTHFFDPEAMSTPFKTREFLSNRENSAKVRTMNSARWEVCLLALRIAEHKYKLCLEALRERSFFETAGTA